MLTGAKRQFEQSKALINSALILTKVTKMIKVHPQIMTSYDRIANERPVYTVIDQW